jgi:hypothetical protein
MSKQNGAHPTAEASTVPRLAPVLSNAPSTPGDAGKNSWIMARMTTRWIASDS